MWIMKLSRDPKVINDIFSESLMAIKNDIKILFTNTVKVFNVKSANLMGFKIYKMNYLFYDIR